MVFTPFLSPYNFFPELLALLIVYPHASRRLSRANEESAQHCKPLTGKGCVQGERR